MVENPLVKMVIVNTIVQNGDSVELEHNIRRMESTAKAVNQVGFSYVQYCYHFT